MRSSPRAQRAGEELAMVSGRRPGGEALSPAELRVAQLAAAGRFNREIAEELVISERTVESHLSAVYRKLGIRSRRDLGSARVAPAGSD
jgi:DNA-binding NarL/FixJ family response regulator